MLTSSVLLLNRHNLSADKPTYRIWLIRIIISRSLSGFDFLSINFFNHEHVFESRKNWTKSPPPLSVEGQGGTGRGKLQKGGNCMYQCRGERSRIISELSTFTWKTSRLVFRPASSSVSIMVIMFCVDGSLFGLQISSRIHLLHQDIIFYQDLTRNTFRKWDLAKMGTFQWYIDNYWKSSMTY